ncbi:lymphocyte antigen-6, epidermis [Lampris incognitus]|uniref:lymphocyte antigen-6, epidermis n=1 Tax=Lampris incognitus TaxID=2546036 RepID=UPI0024B5B360|nr:lymphocyte antigen-6, epidermis [Lampris incognitus]
MSNLWKGVIVLGAFIAVAQCLTCKQCPIGIFGTCLFPNDVVCDNSTLNCFTGEASFNSTGLISLHTRGCLDSDLCGKTLTGAIFEAGFTSSFQCCQTDLCNGASHAHLSLAAALSATILASVWGQLAV